MKSASSPYRPGYHTNCQGLSEGGKMRHVGRFLVWIHPVRHLLDQLFVILCDVVEVSERANGELRLIKELRLRGQGGREEQSSTNDGRDVEGSNTF